MSLLADYYRIKARHDKLLDQGKPEAADALLQGNAMLLVEVIEQLTSREKTNVVDDDKDINALIQEFDEYKESLRKGGEMTEADVVKAVAFAMAFRNQLKTVSNKQIDVVKVLVS